MANELKSEAKAQVVSLLCEGSSIRSIERITGIHRDTVIWTARMTNGRASLPCWKSRQLNRRKLPCVFKS